MTFLLLAIGVFFVISSAKTTSDYFSPVKFYIITYSLLLAGYSLYLSPQQTPWSLSAKLLFTGSTISFISAGIIVHVLAIIKNRECKFNLIAIRQKYQENAYQINWNWFYMVWLVCAGVYFFSFIAGLVTGSQIPLFAENPESARMVFHSHLPLIIGAGSFCGPLSLMLAVELILVGKQIKRKKISIYIISLLVLSIYMMFVSRLDLFRFMIFAAIFYHYTKRNLDVRYILMLLGLGLLVFVGMALTRATQEGLQAIIISYKLHLPKNLFWVASPYMYLCNNFWNFDFVIRKYYEGQFSYPMSWGFELFRGVFMFPLHLEGIMQGTFGFDSIFNESAAKVPGYNSILYQWHFFKDFGIVGVMLIPMIMGFAVSSFYWNTILKPTLFRLCVLTVFIGMILFSFMVPLWGFWYTSFNIVVFAIAHKKIRV